MSSAIHFPDLTTRLRRATRLTGLLPLAIDGSLAGDVVLANLDVDPYRQEPKTFSSFQTVAAVAAEASFVAVQAAPQTVVCIDAVTVSTNAANSIFDVFLDRNAAFPSATYNVAGAAFAALNQASQPSAAEGTSLDPLANFGGNNSQVVPAKGQLAAVFAGGAVANVPATYVFPEPFVLYGSPQGVAKLGDILIVFTGTVNTAVGCGFWGREYTQILTFPSGA